MGISPPTQAAFDALFSTLVDDFISGRSESVVSGKVTAPPSANPTNTSASGASSNDQSVQSAAQKLETTKSRIEDPKAEGRTPASPSQDPIIPAKSPDQGDS